MFTSEHLVLPEIRKRMSLQEKRREAADDMLSIHDFDTERVVETGQWENDGDDEYRATLYMEGIVLPKYRQTFIVRFRPNSDQVLDAYPGDPR